MALAKSSSTPSRSERGFSLVETVVAMAILATSLVGMAHMFALATSQNIAARSTTSATILAQEKIEQLRGLTWGFDQLNLPISDFASNTTIDPPSPTGGTGLSPSFGDTLSQNVDGYVDYVGRLGQPLGGGATPPPGTAYVRRWSIEPLPTNPNNTLILQVLTFEVNDRANSSGDASVRRPDEARLTTVKTRKAF